MSLVLFYNAFSYYTPTQTLLTAYSTSKESQKSKKIKKEFISIVYNAILYYTPTQTLFTHASLQRRTKITNSAYLNLPKLIQKAVLSLFQWNPNPEEYL
jgi:hypothetical protein